MNAKKAKAIRRALAGARGPQVDYRYHVTAHPFVSMNGGTNVRYRFQVVSTGWRRLCQVAKRIYKDTGVLPRAPKPEDIRS